jgi:hypothetical protein
MKNTNHLPTPSIDILHLHSFDFKNISSHLFTFFFLFSFNLLNNIASFAYLTHILSTIPIQTKIHKNIVNSLHIVEIINFKYKNDLIINIKYTKLTYKIVSYTY